MEKEISLPEAQMEVMEVIWDKGGRTMFGVLASKSAQASRNSADLITHSLKAVEDGTLIVDATAVYMRNALNGVQNVVKTMDDIASASREQAYSVEQVTREMEQIAGVIQENSATAEESAAASEELSAQALLLKGLL